MKKALQILFPLLLAVALVWWVFKDMKWEEVRHALSQANWGLVALSIVPSLVAHLARAQRWRLLIEPVAPVPTLWESFAAVMAGYLANLALPRAGELVRCTLLARKRGISVEVSLGTVIAERAFDVVLLLLITALAFILQFQTLLTFFSQLLSGKDSEAATEKGAGGLGLYLLIFAVGGALLLWVLRKRLAKLPFYSKVLGMVKGLLAGVFSALRLKQRGQFLFLTVLIWFCYYLSSWICLEALPELRGIGPLGALMIFTIGSYGMVAPVQGGYGPFEFMVITSLTGIYQYSQVTAEASAILMHNSQTAFCVLLGAPLLAWLAFGKRHLEPETVAKT